MQQYPATVLVIILDLLVWSTVTVYLKNSWKENPFFELGPKQSKWIKTVDFQLMLSLCEICNQMFAVQRVIT